MAGAALGSVLDAVAAVVAVDATMPIHTALLFGAMGAVTAAITSGVASGVLAAIGVTLAAGVAPSTGRPLVWIGMGSTARLVMWALEKLLLFDVWTASDQDMRLFVVLTFFAAVLAGAVGGVVSARIENRFAETETPDVGTSRRPREFSRRGAVVGSLIGAAVVVLLQTPISLFGGMLGGTAESTVSSVLADIAPMMAGIAILFGGLPGALIGGIWHGRRQ
jgi:hypothetical protein